MTMSAREKSSLAVAPPATELEWTADEEIQLFFALADIKPVGINKHFYMACITERLCKSLNREISAEAIWAHLRTMYNLELLDEMEPLPFPNEEKEFSLPDTEFSALLSKKRAESEEKRLSSTDSNIAGGPPSIIAVATDNTGKEKPTAQIKAAFKELEKKITSKLIEAPKRTQKRTRGSVSLESNSPSTTPPPTQSNKRRRI